MIYSQAESAIHCIEALPICGSSQFSYPNTSGLILSEIGPDYGCLRAQRNPSWFYFQITEDGDLEFRIEQSTIDGGTPNLDVDFIVYGPFNDPRTPCFSDLTISNTIDCSYSNNVVEFANLQNTNSGEYYLLLITNFSGDQGFISVTQTAGAATSNCVFLNNPIVESFETCEEDELTLNATTNQAVNYKWYEQDAMGLDKIINGVNTPEYNVTITNTYKVEAFDVNNVLLERFKFNVIFHDIPRIPNQIEDYTICDIFYENDGLGEFDLATKDLEILNGLDQSLFLVSYYASSTDATNGFPQLPIIYNNKSTIEEIYVRVENIKSGGASCFDVSKFKIQVNPLPITNFEEEYILCVNMNGTEEVITPPLLDTQLNSNDYSFSWSLNNSTLQKEHDAFLIAEKEGDYSVEITDKASGCTNIIATVVNVSSPPIISVKVTTLAFANNHRIEASATGYGNQEFLFSLDGGIWQENGVFDNVTFGEHEITSRDKNGCGKSSEKVMVIDYPNYFTPNGDGVNDYWNIAGLSPQYQAKIYLFDRYGKFLKQIDPISMGWDGSYNGRLMKTDDYWFAVEYFEPINGKLNTYKAHFTLKR